MARQPNILRVGVIDVEAPKTNSFFRNLSSSSLVIVVIGEVDLDHAAVPVVGDIAAVVVQVLGERGDSGASGLALALVVKQILLSFSSVIA